MISKSDAILNKIQSLKTQNDHHWVNIERLAKAHASSPIKDRLIKIEENVAKIIKLRTELFKEQQKYF